MGMQCHFSIRDIPAGYTRAYDIESDTTELLVRDGYTIRAFSVDNDITKDNAWFDVGSRSHNQMEHIEWLIRNRICFQCS